MLRERMVKTTIAARGIRDQRVLDAMARVPRHEFVDETYLPLAYDDRPLPIGHGQTISQPYIVALMSEQLGLSDLKGVKVLEVGTGSGYQAAILAEMGCDVFSIEIVSELARSASDRLKRLGYGGVNIRAGDGYKGWSEQAPFDGIIVTAAPTQIPELLIEQLAPGARMIIPVGGEAQMLKVVTRTLEGDVQQDMLPVRFVPMTGEAEAQ